MKRNGNINDFARGNLLFNLTVPTVLIFNNYKSNSPVNR